MSSRAAEPSLQQTLGHAAGLLRSAQRAVAITGAGISTPSGIPDFRSPNAGLWRRFDPGQVASLTAFRYDPEAVFGFLRPLARRILEAVPNAAHQALARLEAAGRLVGVITQNVDDLHRRAGSQRLAEVHGTVRQATCITCYRQVESQPFLEAFVTDGAVPRCPDCGGVLKPNVILFGEALPRAEFERARAWCQQADVVLVAGSSLEVTPVAGLPQAARQRGARLIILNRQPTYLDDHAAAVVRSDLVEVLPQLAAEVLGG